jgi:hypothetical protein
LLTISTVPQPNYFTDGFEGVKAELALFSDVMKVLDPKMHKHLSQFNDFLPYPFFLFFRWLLVLFRQEFSLTDSIRLWESIFAHPIGIKYGVFVASAMVLLERQSVLEFEEYGEVLSTVNRLGESLGIEKVLEAADLHYNSFKKTIRSCSGNAVCKEINFDVLSKLSI